MEERDRNREPCKVNSGPKVPHNSHVCLSPDYPHLQAACLDKVLSPGSLTDALAGRTLPQQAVPTTGSATPCSTRHAPILRGQPSPVMRRGQTRQAGHTSGSPSPARPGCRDPHWGEKELLVLRGNSQSSHITTITRKGNKPPRTSGGIHREQEGVAGLPPAGAKGGVRGYTRRKGDAKERREPGACKPPLGRIQRAMRGCIRDAWVGIPQVASS